jgi:hypothetical protein
VRISISRKTVTVLLVIITLFYIWNSFSIISLQFHRFTAQRSVALTHGDTVLNISMEIWNNRSVVKKMNRKEISISGKMFDVEKITYERNNIKLIGHFDNEEDELINFIASKNSNPENFMGNFGFLYFQEITPYQVAYKMQHFEGKPKFYVYEPSLLKLSLYVEPNPPKV